MCVGAQLCPTLCDQWTGYSPPGSSVHGIFQAGILEWVAFSSPEDLPKPGIEPGAPAFSGGFFTTSTTWETHNLVLVYYYLFNAVLCIVVEQVKFHLSVQFSRSVVSDSLRPHEP